MTKLEPVKKQSLAARVFEQLRDHIVGGELKPGDTLPAERVLAKRLQVNRQAVREALKRLEQAGLVSIQQGGATRVLDFRESAGLELLAAMLMTPDGTLNTGVARSVIEMRAALGPKIARASAERRDSGHVRALRKTIDAMTEADAAGDLVAMQALAMDLWGFVVDGTGNLAYRLAYNSLDRTYRDVMSYLTDVLEEEIRALEDYTAMVDAIEAGDPDAAAEAGGAIVARGARSMTEVLDRIDALET